MILIATKGLTSCSIDFAFPYYFSLLLNSITYALIFTFNFQINPKEYIFNFIDTNHFKFTFSTFLFFCKIIKLEMKNLFLHYIKIHFNKQNKLLFIEKSDFFISEVKIIKFE